MENLPDPVEAPLAGPARAPDTSALGTERLRYVPSLDGIRAFAVLGVMAYHGGVGWLQGGFLGVDAFFVLSGFLITTLLIDEWRSTGSIGLGGFWSRRARRLLPALFLLIAAIAAYCVWFAPPDTLHDLRVDALYTLGYSANWHQILASQNYFAQSALPSPLLHTWSLAIEEQFYIVWPPVVLGILLWKGRGMSRASRLGRPGRRALRPLLRVAMLGAAASAVAMGLLYQVGDPTRVYYGTDTRAQSILVGAALAILLAGRPVSSSKRAKSGLVVAAGAGTATVAWMWVEVTGNTGWLYRGGFALAAVCVAALIACVALVPSGLPARILSLSPLRWTGRISYGLYLWHWPIYLVVDNGHTGLVGYELLAVRVAATFVAATLSYYLVERPIRRGFVHSWRSWVLTPAAAAATCLAVVAATVPAEASGSLASSPGTSPAVSLPQGSGGGAPSTTAPGTPPERVLLVGDSVALTLGMGLSLAAPHYGIDFRDEAIIGCGVAQGGPLYDTGNVTAPVPDCAQWPQTYARDVQSFKPDVVMLLVGPWEVLDRVHDGRWEHIGQPGFDAYEAQQLQRAVDVLGAKGARVVLLTSPYYDHGEQPNGEPWPQDDPARVNQLNKLLEQVAARNPGVASVIPLGSYMSPGDRYTTTVDGIDMRWSDGIHISVPGGEYLARLVFPQVIALGRQAAPTTTP